MPPDARLTAFSSSPLEVFDPVAALAETWTPDPLDCETLQSQARTIFRQLLEKATTPNGEGQLQEPGRVLLLTGPLGSGRTHLIRAFRGLVHDEGLGYLGALQLTTTSLQYGRYLLGNLIDSLSHPYNPTVGPTTSLQQLAAALARNCGDSALQERLLSGDEPEAIEQAVAQLRQQPRFQTVDVNLLRVLLLLHRHDQLTTMRVMRYLRCESLTTTDCQALGGVPPPAEDAPERLIAQLGELIRAVGRSLVICIDQLEGAVDKALPPDAFRRAMKVVTGLAEQIRGSIFVVACLPEFYEQLRPQLTRAIVEALETNPPRLALPATCSPAEVEQLVATRLRSLFERSGTAFDTTKPVSPYPRDELRQKLNGNSPRVVLAACRKWRERTQARGRLAEQLLLDDREIPAETLVPVEQQWNDFRARWQQAPSVLDRELSELLEWALAEADKEEGPQRLVVRRAGDFLGVNVATATSARRLLLLVSNVSARSGWLVKHVDSIDGAAKERTAVLVRCEAFPTNPASAAGQRCAQFQQRPQGGRCVVLQDADLRAMAALRAFQQDAPPRFDEWRRAYRPLLRLPSMQAVLG